MGFNEGTESAVLFIEEAFEFGRVGVSLVGGCEVGGEIGEEGLEGFEIGGAGEEGGCWF